MLQLMTDLPRPGTIADSSAPLDPPPAKLRRHLGVFRSISDRYIAGVAGGVAEGINVDPLFIRLGLAAATLFLGREGGPAAIPLIAYFVAWLIFPTRSTTSLLRRVRQRAAQQEIVGAGAVLALALLVLSRPNLIWAGVLFAVAVAMLTDRNDLATPRGAPPVLAAPDQTPSAPLPTDLSDGSTLAAVTFDTTDPDPAVSDRAVSDRAESTAVGSTAVGSTAVGSTELSSIVRARTWGRSLRGAPLAPHEPSVRAPRPPARSPKLWPLTVALLFAYALACVLLDNLVAGGIDPGVAVNGALLIIGAVMLLSGWRGRAWLTLLLAVPLVPLWVAFSVAGIDRVPDRPFSPTALDDGDVIQASQGYGGLLVDLWRSELPSSGEITAAVGVTAGQIDVWVPRDAEIRLIGDIGLGNVQVYREFDWYSSETETLSNWGLDRTYRALGRECFDNSTDDLGLGDTAEISQVTLPSSATPYEIADAIEAAGYPRPTVETNEQTEQLFNENGDQIFETVGENLWTYQSNENGGLCNPEPPPDNPLVITIDATLGIGNLKVHRV